MKRQKAIVLLGCCGILGVFLYVYTNKSSNPQTIQAKVTEVEIDTEIEQNYFEIPDSYKKEIPDSSLSFDAEVIVPENFDADNLYMGTANKVLDRDKIYHAFFKEGKEVQKDTWNAVTSWGENEAGETDEDRDGNYLLLEGNYHANFESVDGTYINNCVRVDTIEGENNIDILEKVADLEFMGKEQAKENVESFLNSMGLSTKGNQYTIFALDVETLKEQEKIIDKYGNDTNEGKNPEWTKEQEGYYFFGEQTFQGLPVWSKISVEDSGYFENIIELPIQIFYSEKGVRLCDLKNYYQMEENSEKVVLAPFERIVESIEDKYKDLDSNGLIVRKMKLMEFPKRQKDGTYQMIPVWVCFMDVIMSDGERETLYLQMPINAITGEEEIAIEGTIM